MPANAYGQHIEAGPVQRLRRLQPRLGHPAEDPRHQHRRRRGRDGLGADQQAEPVREGEGTRRGDRRPHGQRWPIWTEIDSNAEDSSKAVLEIHPAVNFNSGDRYIVALRNLKNAAGEHLQAPAAFQYYRDDVPSAQGPINEWRPHYEELFSVLKKRGIGRTDLYLAWDFTVASDQNNTSRELSMRNDAFAQLGDTNLADGIPQGVSPTFEVTKVENEPNPGQIARRVIGTFDVPCFLFPNCGPGGTMHLDAEGNPIQNGTWTANFDCIIPDSVTTGPAGSGRPSLYGHGLLGDASEVGSGPQRSLSQGHKIVQCATDEIGMAESDLGSVIAALENVSAFPTIPDRLQQGLLDELYLGRAMISSSGFTTQAAFHQDGTLSSGSVLDTEHLFYNGNSQGGIMGGALTAVSPDFTRASLGVPAMNYSVLLPRSVDFDEFAQVLYPFYPDETTRPLVLGLMQMLWDRSEPDGYAERMTGNPLPDTPQAPGVDGRGLRRSPGQRLPGRRRGPHRRRPTRTNRRSTRAAGRRPTSSGTCRSSSSTRSPARPSTTGTSARSAKTRSTRARKSASNRRRTKTFPTAAAKTRTRRRATRPPSSSSYPTSSKGPSPSRTPANAARATRGASPGRRGRGAALAGRGPSDSAEGPRERGRSARAAQ